MLFDAERHNVVHTCLALVTKKLVVGTAGNVSTRVGDHVIISPSAVPYEKMTAEDVVVVDLEGVQLEGNFTPSSELPLHLSVYLNTDAQAIVHTHAEASTALGIVMQGEIPPCHYYAAFFGGPVRVSPYARFGTDQLAANVVEALRGRSAALMSNHGAIVTASTLEDAVDKLPYLEYLCEIHLRALATGLSPKILSPEQMDEAVVGMSRYTRKEAGGLPSS